MRPFLIALALIALNLGGSATAQNQPAPLAKYVVVFTSPAWQSNPTEAALVNLVRAPPPGSPLAPWVDRAAVKHFTPRDPNYARFANLAPPENLPVVVVQRPDGGYVYKASGDNVPTDAYTLGREIDYYAGLDPLPAKYGDGGAVAISDSATMHGRVKWLTEQDFCPDGTCTPQPRIPAPAVSPRRPFVQVGPDSVDINPSVDTGPLAAPLIVGVIIVAIVGGLLAALLLFLIAAFAAYRYLRS